jgi:hypothetical protein
MALISDEMMGFHQKFETFNGQVTRQYRANKTRYSDFLSD